MARELDKVSLDFIIIDKVVSSLYPEKSLIGDVRDPEALKNHLQGSDIIVNLAAEHRDDVSPLSLYSEVNVTGAENVCHAASELGIRRIIFTSSVAVYGHAEPEADEDAVCRPFNEYGRTKLEAEAVYNKWREQNTGNSLAVVRPTVVFGEDNRGNVYNLLNQIASRKFLFVGNGRNHKAMAYVGNVVSFLMHLLNHPELAGTWNYVDTPVPDMNELVSSLRKKLGIGKGTGLKIPGFVGLIGGSVFDIAASITGRKFPISRVRISKFMADSSFSAKRALGTGFQPPFNLNVSLNRVLSYEFPDLYVGPDTNRIS